MFAVIKTGGKQYRVAADDLLKVEKVSGETGDMVEFDNVLVVGEGKDAAIGAPFVDGAVVTAEIVDQGRAKKVITFKKRRRQNSRRTIGHRQLLTTVRISEILTGGVKPSKKAAAKKEVPKKDASEKGAPKKEAKAKEEAPANKPEPKAEAKPAAKKEEAPAAAAPLFKAPKGDGDDLTNIKGIGPVAAGQLNEQGITTYAQIAKLSDKDIERIDEAMPFSADQISDWRDQAKEMAK